MKSNQVKNRGGVRKKWLSAYKSSNISERRQDSSIKVIIEVHYEVIKVTYVLSIGAKINDLG